MARIIRTYSGDDYEVPTGQEHEIEGYRAAVEVIKRNRIRPVPEDEHERALEIMMEFEEGHTGWRYIDGQ